MAVLLFFSSTTTTTRASAFTMDAALSLTTNLATAYTAYAEILEDFESIHRGHGMLLLSASRVCREINLMRESTVDEVEEIEEGNERNKERQYQHVATSNELSRTSPPKVPSAVEGMIEKPLSVLLGILTNHKVAMLLSFGALLAAWVEVSRTFRLGAHHGVLFLSLNELIELRETANRPPIVPFLRRTTVRLGIVAVATAVALYETAWKVWAKQHTAVGVHHGTLLMGISQTVRCIGLIRKERKELRREEKNKEE
jgi:hypothetical protein